jgi:uncharacterized OB-fold protein
MSAPRGLLVSRCRHCHNRFLPRRGACPRCGSREVDPVEVPPQGVVLAATEVLVPASAAATPRRIALVEGADGLRLLAVVEGELPAIGTEVTVVREVDRYVAFPSSPTAER